MSAETRKQALQVLGIVNLMRLGWSDARILKLLSDVRQR
jgi:hypothetical protein